LTAWEQLTGGYTAYSLNTTFNHNSLALAFQLPSQVLPEDVPYGKIIQASVSTKPFEMMPGFPVPISGIVFLKADPKFPASFDTYFENF
jgi:hypothetical protein